MRPITFVLIIAVMTMAVGNLNAATVISCSSGNSCTVGLLSTSSFGSLVNHTISTVGLPISASGGVGNQQTFSYDGQNVTITCNGSWQNLPTPSFPTPEQNQIACTIINGDPVKESIQLKIFTNANVSSNSSIVAALSKYTSASPYSVQNTVSENNVSATGIAKEWESLSSNLDSVIGYDVSFYIGYDADGSDGNECFWAMADKTCKDIWSTNQLAWTDQNSNNTTCLMANPCTTENLNNLSTIIKEIVFPTGQCVPYTDPIYGTAQCYQPNLSITSSQFLSRTCSGDVPGCYGSDNNYTHQLWHIQAFTADPSGYTLHVLNNLIVGVKNTQVSIFATTTVSNLLFVPMATINPTDTTTGATDKLDNGQVNSAGECLGTIYIFNGKDNRCRTAGLETAYTNCCDNGSTAPPDILYIDPVFWPVIIGLKIMDCSSAENRLSTARTNGLCHYLGKYCSASLPLFGCIQKKETYCCFNSMLGRILQEQGRPTLKDFGPTGSWGTPKSPNCRGFTANEFQNIDFSKVNLSEWYGHIQTQTQQEITNTIQNNINQLYGK